MANSCYYHPSLSSVGSCIQCGMPICGDCREQVGDKAICKKCAPVFKPRLEQQMAAASAVSQTGKYPGYAPSPTGGSMSSAYGGVAAAGRTSDMKEVLLGIGLATMIGIIGAIIIEKILFYSGFGLSLLYIGLGYGIGWGIHRASGRGGTWLALAAVGVMVFCLGISHLVFAQDLLNAARNSGRADASVTLFDAVSLVIPKLGIMHWVCIGFGLLACYRGMEA